MTVRMAVLVGELEAYHDLYRGDGDRVKGALMAKRAAEALTKQSEDIEKLEKEVGQLDAAIESMKNEKLRLENNFHELKVNKDRVIGDLKNRVSSLEEELRAYRAPVHSMVDGHTAGEL